MELAGKFTPVTVTTNPGSATGGVITRLGVSVLTQSKSAVMSTRPVRRSACTASIRYGPGPVVLRGTVAEKLPEASAVVGGRDTLVAFGSKIS